MMLYNVRVATPSILGNHQTRFKSSFSEILGLLIWKYSKVFRAVSYQNRDMSFLILQFD